MDVRTRDLRDDGSPRSVRTSIPGFDPARLNLCLMALLIASCLFYLPHMLNHDTSWYLVATRKWLDGAVLYRDIMEINPPLSFYLTVPAIVFADFTGIPEDASFSLLCMLAISFSLVWIRSMTERSVGAISMEGIAIVAGSATALLLICSGSFGQREHMMAIFALPLFVNWALRPCGLKTTRTERILLGAYALPGLLLKPYFLFPPALLILFSSIQDRSWKTAFDPSAIVVGLGSVAYLCFIVVVHPDYMSTILPAAKIAYGSFEGSWEKVLGKLQLVGTATISLTILASLLQRPDRTASRLLVLCVGFVVVYVIQSKGWEYQADSVAVPGIMLLAWTATMKSPRAVVVCGAVLSATLLIVFHQWNGYRNPIADAFASHLTDVRPGDGIMVLSSNVSAGFPLTNFGRYRWDSSYPAQWIVPGALVRLHARQCLDHLHDASCTSAAELLDTTRSRMVADFVENRPDAVLIDERNDKDYFQGIPFDYLDFLSEDESFPKFWDAYTKIGTFDGYGFWKRGTAASMKNVGSN
jgi:hypothetical protein